MNPESSLRRLSWPDGTSGKRNLATLWALTPASPNFPGQGDRAQGDRAGAQCRPRMQAHSAHPGATLLPLPWVTEIDLLPCLQNAAASGEERHICSGGQANKRSH